jgi:hypothetical protein
LSFGFKGAIASLLEPESRAVESTIELAIEDVFTHRWRYKRHFAVQVPADSSAQLGCAHVVIQVGKKGQLRLFSGCIGELISMTSIGLLKRRIQAHSGRKMRGDAARIRKVNNGAALHRLWPGGNDQIRQKGDFAGSVPMAQSSE